MALARAAKTPAAQGSSLPRARSFLHRGPNSQDRMDLAVRRFVVGGVQRAGTRVLAGADWPPRGACRRAVDAFVGGHRFGAGAIALAAGPGAGRRAGDRGCQRSPPVLVARCAATGISTTRTAAQGRSAAGRDRHLDRRDRRDGDGRGGTRRCAHAIAVAAPFGRDRAHCAIRRAWPAAPGRAAHRR